LTPSELHIALATRIEEQLTNWKQSLGLPDLLGRDPSSIDHLGFSVDLVAGRAGGGRQSTNYLHIEQVVIRFLFRVKPKDQVTSVRDALEQEQLLVKALVAKWNPQTHLIYESSRRNSLPTGEWRQHEVTFNSQFYLSLE